jgi:hypothetical protein
MRLTTTFLALLLVPRLAGAQQPTYRPFVPPNGFVPDSATAVRIAVAVWAPIYGANDCQNPPQQPVAATLDDGVWTVTRGVQCSGSAIIIEIKPGMHWQGVLQDPPADIEVVKIAKRDGRVLYQGRT